MLEDSVMVRPPAKKLRDVMLGFRVTAELKKALEKAAADDNRSVSGLVITILIEWLKARKYLK
jgi:hypothetical protein